MGKEMSLTVQKQQNHISQLLNTAAAGTGVVGDLDALLTPIQMTPVVEKTESKPERNLWREDEMLQMLTFMHSTNALELLNDKTVKSEKVFRNVEKLMYNCGYRKKSYMQIWTKWKFLKSTYMTSTRAGVIPKVVPYKIYQMLHKILSNSGVNGGATSSVDEYNSDGGLVISNVESGCLTNGSKDKESQPNLNEASLDNDRDADDESGLAHPIFGFRLGLVKEEPVDGDFEPANNTIITDDPLDENNAISSCSSAVNTHFQTEIKEEVVDSDSSQKHQQNAINDSPEENTVETILPVPKLPPLRIAPFAKVPMHNANLQQQQNRSPIINRSPPPLSLHSAHQQHRQQQQRQQQQQQQAHRHFTRQSQGHTIPNFNNQNPNHVRMLLPKTNQIQQQQGPATPIRIPKDITIHQTRPLTSAHTMPRLKTMQMRNMQPFHPQRIETVLPDTDAQIMLQQKKQQQYAINFINNGGASTSQQAALGRMLTPAMINQKRRLQMPYTDSPRPTKLTKTYINMKQASVVNEADVYQGDDDDDEEDDDDDSEYQDDNSSMLEPMKQSFQHAKQQQDQQQQQQFRQFQQQKQSKKAKKLKKEEESFEASLRGLGKSLRSIQRELIDEFFEKQMELAREEHEFQSKQDALLMEAFEEQAQLIMKSAKRLLGIDLPGIKSTKENQARVKVEHQKPDIKTPNGNKKEKAGEQLEEQDEEDDENEEEENEESQGIYGLDEEDTNAEDNDVEENDDTDFDEEDQESQNPLGDPIEMVSSELYEDN